MLTADHVMARRSKGTLKLTTLDAKRKARGLEIAAQFHDLAVANRDLTRAELLEAWSAVRFEARDRKLADGLKKLIDDGLVFEVCVDVDPVALRKETFERATAIRQGLDEDARFDRGALLAEIGARRGLDADEVERGLFGDLKSAQVLKAVESPPPKALIERYDLEQARAVLLRAVRLTARIRGAKPAAMRALFRKLKFRRLLHTVHREADGSYRIEIDGPFSLFESVTKYGLSLALALPAIIACGRWSIDAEIRWGKQRTAMRFALEGKAHAEDDELADDLPEEARALLERFSKRSKSPWVVARADDIIDLPGVGLCVPDLAFTHQKTGEVVLLEVMGFWSRDAVWKRVELVEGGLDRKILFAASSRLRVSEAVLPDDVPGALYVYKGVMSAARVEEKLNALAARG